MQLIFSIRAVSTVYVFYEQELYEWHEKRDATNKGPINCGTYLGAGRL
jgi:hypothetical protein